MGEKSIIKELISCMGEIENPDSGVSLSQLALINESGPEADVKPESPGLLFLR